MPKEKPHKRNMLGTFIIASIAYIVLGIFMVAYPDKATGGFRIVIGIILMIYGIINVISFFLNKDNEENLFMELALGVLAIGIGIFALIAPKPFEMVIFYSLGAVLIIEGVVNIKRAVNMKDMGFKKWKIILIGSFISILFGIICIILYSNIGEVISFLIGIALIYEGLSSLITIFIDARTRKKVVTSIALAESERELD